MIVPCYNEEETIMLFHDAIQTIEQKLNHYDWEYLFINDGSTDTTLAILKELATNHPETVSYLSFSRNFGKEAAMAAGLQHAIGDYVAVMDVDLQDPPELLIEMTKLLETTNYDCIGARRVDRKDEPPIRSFFARRFYSLINKISDTEFVDGVRDFRLMTRQMVNAILSLEEYNRFSKGIFSWVGFDTYYIEFENKERSAGETSWSFWRLFKYSIEGILSFSTMPLLIASFLGIVTFLSAITFLIIIIIRALIFGDPVAGWPSLVSIILFLGGIQLFCMGVIGQYIGKMFLETKKRPLFIIKEANLIRQTKLDKKKK